MAKSTGEEEKALIEKYLKLIEAEERKIELPLPVTLHVLYMHDATYDFTRYGWNNYDCYEQERDLLTDLDEKNIEAIARYFKLGVLDETIEEDAGQHFTKDMESYERGMKFRRPITTNEKEIFLRAMNGIYGSEDRLKVISAVFKEKNTNYINLVEKLYAILEANRAKIARQRKAEEAKKDCKFFKISGQYTLEDNEIVENQTWEGYILVDQGSFFEGVIKHKNNIFDARLIMGSILKDSGDIMQAIYIAELSKKDESSPIQIYGINKGKFIDGYYNNLPYFDGKLWENKQGLIRISLNPEEIELRKLNYYINNTVFWKETNEIKENQKIIDYINNFRQEVREIVSSIIEQKLGYQDPSEFENQKTLQKK